MVVPGAWVKRSWLLKGVCLQGFQGFPRAPAYFLPVSGLNEGRFANPGTAAGCHFRDFQPGADVARVNAARGHDAHARMAERGQQGFKHPDASRGLRREKLLEQAPSFSPDVSTATNLPAPYVTSDHLPAGIVVVFQFTQSVLYAAFVPLAGNATNMSLPYPITLQLVGIVDDAQFIPS